MTNPSNQSEDTFTLLVWESIPEAIDFYLIPNSVADKYREFLSAANGKFINTDYYSDALKFLNAALCDDLDYVEQGEERNCGLFAAYKHEGREENLFSPIENTHITHVYLSGVAM